MKDIVTEDKSYSNLQILPLTLNLTDEPIISENKTSSMPLNMLFPHIRTQQTSISLTQIYQIVLNIINLSQTEDKTLDISKYQ